MNKRTPELPNGYTGKTVSLVPISIITGTRAKLVGILDWYKQRLSPRIAEQGIHCIYEQTCSEYAKQQFESKPISIAFAKTTWRLLSCNPINAYIKNKELKKCQ